jgi:hypothetical protein
MSRLLALAVVAGSLLAGCDAVFGLTPSEMTGDDVPLGSERSRQIVIDAPITAPLSDFTISIYLENDPDLRAHATPSGADIRFFDANSNELQAEVKYSEGTLEAYVRVSTLEKHTELTMHYGTGTRTGDPRDAWGNKFYAVWHMDSAASEPDSTHTALIMSQRDSAPIPSRSPIGAIGASRAYVGTTSNSDVQQLCDASNTAFPPVGVSFAISMWIKGEDAVGQYAQPFYAGGTDTGKRGVSLELDNHAPNKPWNIIYTGSTGEHEELPIAPLDPTKWIHLAVVFEKLDPIKVHIYSQGQLVDLHEAPFSVISTDPDEQPCLGGDNSYGGLLDEVRVYQDYLSEDWVAAEYANVARRQTFMTIGAPE